MDRQKTIKSKAFKSKAWQRNAYKRRGTVEHLSNTTFEFKPPEDETVIQDQRSNAKSKFVFGKTPKPSRQTESGEGVISQRGILPASMKRNSSSSDKDLNVHMPVGSFKPQKN